MCIFGEVEERPSDPIACQYLYQRGLLSQVNTYYRPGTKPAGTMPPSRPVTLLSALSGEFDLALEAGGFAAVAGWVEFFFSSGLRVVPTFCTEGGTVFPA